MLQKCRISCHSLGIPGAPNFFSEEKIVEFADISELALFDGIFTECFIFKNSKV